jgi:hypothetical protein
MTKNHMARLIVLALYNSSKLPKSDNVNVKRLAKSKMRHLEDLLELALNVFKTKPELIENLTNFELPYSVLRR